MKLLRVIEGQISVHLVRRYLVIAHVICARSLQQAIGADDVGLYERLGIEDGVIVMTLSRIVDDRITARHHPVKQLSVTDVTAHEVHTIFWNAVEVVNVARVSEFVEHRNVNVRVMVDHVMDEI